MLEEFKRMININTTTTITTTTAKITTSSRNTTTTATINHYQNNKVEERKPIISQMSSFLVQNYYATNEAKVVMNEHDLFKVKICIRPIKASCMETNVIQCI